MLIVCPVAGLGAAEAGEAAEPLPTEWYGSGFLTRNTPIGSILRFGDDEIPHTSFSGATGGGLKVGVFPRFFKSILGGEIEAVGHGGSFTAPQTASGGTIRSAQLDTTLFNFRANLIARYPGDLIQPYIGGGLGLSFVNVDGQVQSAAGNRTSSEVLIGAGVQVILGVRLIVTNHVFGFAEYRYGVVFVEGDDGCSGKDEDCAPKPTIGLEHLTHDIAVGIGFRF